MWEYNERVAITIGVDLETYWTETPNQFRKHIDVYLEKEKMRAKEMDVNNYNLGKYIALAVNDPKKYPRKPFLAERERDFEKKPMTQQEIERVIKKNNIILGGITNGNIRQH